MVRPHSSIYFWNQRIFLVIQAASCIPAQAYSLPTYCQIHKCFDGKPALNHPNGCTLRAEKNKNWLRTLFSNVYRFCRALISSPHFSIPLYPRHTCPNYICLGFNNTAKSFCSTPFLPLHSFFERPATSFRIPLSATFCCFFSPISFFWPLLTLITPCTLFPPFLIFHPEKFTFDAQLFFIRNQRDFQNFLFSEKNCLLSSPTYIKKQKKFTVFEKRNEKLFS